MLEGEYDRARGAVLPADAAVSSDIDADEVGHPASAAAAAAADTAADEALQQ